MSGIGGVGNAVHDNNWETSRSGLVGRR
jgi:hypothetical protein